MEVLMVSLDQLLSPYAQAPDISASAVHAKIKENSASEPVFFVYPGINNLGFGGLQMGT